MNVQAEIFGASLVIDGKDSGKAIQRIHALKPSVACSYANIPNITFKAHAQKPND